MTAARRIRRTTVPAVQALRTYWGTSLLVATAGIVALAAILPVTSLLESSASLDSRLIFSTMANTAVSGWGAPVRSPVATQQAAVNALFQVLALTAGAVLVVAVLTLVGLFGARAVARSTELAARRAVGASRRLLTGSALVEGSVLAVSALLAGGTAGSAASLLAASGWPGSLAGASRAPSIAAAGAIGAVVVLAAMLPLVFARGRRIADAPAAPLSLVLPAAQLGLSLVVLTAGTMLARHADRAIEQSAAPSRAGEVFRQPLEQSPPAVRASRYAALLEELGAAEEFETVSLTATGGIVGLGVVSSVTTDCGRCTEGGIFLPWHVVPATHQFVSADSFHALGVRLLAGRGISASDRWGTPPVAVVSRALAIRHFQDGQAIGRRILLGDDVRTWHTVVGVVDDAPVRGLGGVLQPPFTVYASVLQHPAAGVDLLLRTRSGAAVDATAVAAVRRALASRGHAPIRLSEARLIAEEALPLRWFARWIGFEGWVMLGLACGGTFILMRLWVLSLLNELGLRRAVGARRWRLLAFVLGRAGAVGLGGVAIGLWFGPAIWAAVGSVIAGLPVWDAPTVARFAVLLVGVAMAGALQPAVRAIRATPAALLGWS